MTFPLLSGLHKRYPSNPVLFAGEERFYKELQAFVPTVSFFPASKLATLSRKKFEMLINLDSHPLASRFTAAAQANFKIGPQLQENGVQRIAAFWQLYRASLTQNNYHNLFHWGDLNRLDLEYPLSPLPAHSATRPADGRIGLFIGASEAAKRPGPEFWAALVRMLLSRGYKPLLLGGPDEKAAGENIAARAGLKSINFCGKTSLAQLAALLQSLDLLISPDTGPMHLADWLGVPVFNLSMGNVHAPETGPMRPGHLIMRSSISCAGCWQCTRGKLLCHRSFNPALIARIAQAYLKDELSSLDPSTIPAELMLSGRDENGLYSLSPLFPASRNRTRSILDRFWQTAFLFFASRQKLAQPREEAVELARLSPALYENLQKNIKKLLSLLLACAKGKSELPPGLWQSFPRNSSLFAGFLEMYLQNESFSKEALRHALELTAQIEDLLALPS